MKREHDRTRLGPRSMWLALASAAAGLVALALAALWGSRQDDGMSLFLHGYLVGFAFWLSIAAGALWFVLLHHLVRARWSVTIRRSAELLTVPLGLLAALSLVILGPILAGNDSLYVWTRSFEPVDVLIDRKGVWLDGWFFSVRVISYLTILWVMSWWFRRRSVDQDAGKQAELTAAMRRVSAPAMIAFAAVIAFVGFDLLMSLEPRWFSTMFSVYYFAGCGVAIYASLALVPMVWQKLGLAATSITVEHYHDIGKMLLAFVLFWGYIALSQLMLIWYANIPEETAYFRHRILGPWQIVALCLALGHFAVPLVCLLSRRIKRRLAALAALAGWLLVMHWIDLFWVVMPSYGHALDARLASSITAQTVIGPNLASVGIGILSTIGIGGLFIAAVASAARRAHIIPIGDPDLGSSISFVNK